jgi:hypothetical protein
MKNDEMGEEYSAQGGDEKYVQFFFGKPGMKKPLGKPVRRCEDNIKIDRREIGLKSVDWIHLAQSKNQSRALANL